MGKKILFVLGSMGRGGAERVISILSQHFAEDGWDVTIGLLLNFKVDYVLRENVKVVDLTGGGGSRILRLPKWIGGIRGLVKKENPDVIVSFAARINVIVQAACIGLKKRIIVSERNDPYMDGRSRFVDFMTSILYPKADAVVFQTKRASSYFDKLKLKNSLIISNPISVEHTAEVGNGEFIVSVGRLTKQKNQKLLIEAFSDIAGKHPNTKLVIYGEGELRSELEALIDELGLTDRVSLPGNVPNVHEMIKGASAFVLSSDYEGLSNALLEAMMMGLPCISTRCAGSDEYIADGENGLLVDIGSREQLAVAINKMLSDRDAALMMGKAAKESSKMFEKSYVVELWHNVIEKDTNEK